MNCLRCGRDLTVQHGSCPNCGAALRVERSSFGKRKPALLISVSLTVFFVIAGTLGFAAYRLFKTGLAGVPQSSTDVPPHDVPDVPPHTEWPVEHGHPASPDELRGHGRLYFVPVGRQAISVKSLADYYIEKLGAQVTVLPQVEIRPADCVPRRKQCVAEELEAEMTSAYPEIAWIGTTGDTNSETALFNQRKAQSVSSVVRFDIG